jgi:hypothetical protein
MVSAPGQQPTGQAGPPPSGIGGKLHGFWSGQQHAETERIQILLFAQPLALFDNFAVHQGDLCGRSAEG